MYKSIIRPILFKLDAEKVHHLAFKAIKILFKLPLSKAYYRSNYMVEDKRLEKELFGLKFPNPVGLAAGFDKDAKLIDELSYMGFGFVEIGTLTPKPQEGNPKPRLFRLLQDKAIINRMGFNNKGVKDAIPRLKARKSSILVGGNIGKNKVTPNDEAFSDYKICFEELFDYVDYFVVNVSSPNTQNLRALQDKEPLSNLLKGLKDLNSLKAQPKPILLKIAPDLSDEQLDDIIEIVIATKIDGVIATNTTVDRSNLNTHWERVNKIGNGGLSGAPLTSRSTAVIKYLSEKSNKAFPIIGVGGITTAKDALEKLEAGADLVQIYTGFVYEGPQLIKEINTALIQQQN